MTKHRENDTRIVYSTARGRMCPGCGQPVAECTCKVMRKIEPGDGIVRVRRELKGRHGKTVTSISGIPLDERKLLELASKLKRRFGTGGSVKDGIIEIQGDHREPVIEELKKEGYIVKRAGG